VPVNRLENNPRCCNTLSSPITAGIVPVSLFSARYSKRSEDKWDRDDGIVPVSMFELRLMIFSWVRSRPIQVGTIPVKRFSLMSRSIRSWSSFIVSGTLLENRLNDSSRMISWDRLPIVDGMDPSIRLPDRMRECSWTNCPNAIDSVPCM